MADPRVVVTGVAFGAFLLASLRYAVLFCNWKLYPFHTNSCNNVLVMFPFYTFPFDMYLYFAKDVEYDNHRRALAGKLAVMLAVAAALFFSIMMMIIFS